VISPKENMEMWIKFANLCRKSERLELAEKTLKLLLVGDQKLEIIHPSVKSFIVIIVSFYRLIFIN